MKAGQRTKLIQSLLDHYPDAHKDLLADLEEMIESDIKKLEPTLDRMLLDAKFEALLELAAEAQKNELCGNCGVRTLRLPF